MTYSKSSKTRDQILAAAATLFAQLGYTGGGTREIARIAKVNEVTIYRHYAKKRDLFMAAVEWEVQKVQLRAELMAQLVNAPDVRSCLQSIGELIGDAMRQRPNLGRLLQFSALEFGTALGPLFKMQLGSLLDLGVGHLQRWVEAGELGSQDPQVLILAIASAIVTLPTFYPAIWREKPTVFRVSPAVFCAEASYYALAAPALTTDGKRVAVND